MADERGVACVQDHGEPWRLWGPDQRVVLDKRGRSVAEIRFAGPKVRERVVACVNSLAGVGDPMSFLFDCIAALRPLSLALQSLPGLDQLPRDGKTTVQHFPVVIFHRATEALATAGCSPVGRIQVIGDALWDALVALGEPVPQTVAIANTAAVLRLALERLGEIAPAGVTE
jgi:hypothetical protein